MLDPCEVRVFLEDGEPQGFRSITVAQWSGLAIVCPRSTLSRLARRPEASRTGVYLLLSSLRDGSESVYIGETDEGVSTRLRQHDDEEREWQKVVLFVSSEEHRLNKAQVRWLEARLIESVAAAGRVTLENRTRPEGGHLSAGEKANMRVYLKFVYQVLPSAGVDILQGPEGPAHEGQARDDSARLRLYLMTKGAKATCLILDAGYLVEKGSEAVKQETPRLTDSVRKQRADLLARGVLKEKNESLLEFNQDFRFASPSRAADVIGAGSYNGRRNWKLENGQTLAAWEESQSAQPSAPT